jgi:hypothetical protein
MKHQWLTSRSLPTGGRFYFRFFALRRGFLFDEALFGFSAAASSRRFFAAQPGLLTWRPRAIPNPSEGTFSVIVEPAAM